MCAYVCRYVYLLCSVWEGLFFKYQYVTAVDRDIDPRNDFENRLNTGQ